MKLLHYCAEGMPAAPGINYEWCRVSKPRLRIVARLFGKTRELYIRFRPAYQPGMKRRVFVDWRTWADG